MWLKVLLFHSAIKYINFFPVIYSKISSSVFYMRQELPDRQALHLMHVVKSHARAARVACVAGGILVCFSIQCVFERHPRAWSIGSGWEGCGGGGAEGKEAFSSSVQLSRGLLYEPLLIGALTNHK